MVFALVVLRTCQRPCQVEQVDNVTANVTEAKSANSIRTCVGMSLQVPCSSGVLFAWPANPV